MTNNKIDEKNTTQPEKQSKINLIQFVLGQLESNAFLMYREGSDNAILIDAGDEYQKIVSVLNKHSLKLAAVLLTHCHFDHIGAVAALQKDGAEIIVSENFSEKLLDYSISRAPMFIAGMRVDRFDVNTIRKVRDNEIFEVADIQIKAIETKGHAADCMCYLIGDCLFSGDTLFKGSYGRVDLLSGDNEEIKHSIKSKLFSLDDNTSVYCGHGSGTSIRAEKKNNMINF